MILMLFAKRFNNPSPQLLSSAITILRGNDYHADGFSPLVLDCSLRHGFIVMVFIIKDVSGQSGRYFDAQQKGSWD